jgi:hypothetical protein
MPRGDRFHRLNRGESSNIEGENQRGRETSQARIERIRRENMQNFTTVRENQRANETPQEQARRIQNERTQFLADLRRAQSSPDFDQGSFVNQWQQNYIKREFTARGINGSDIRSFNQTQVEEFCKPQLETESIISGEATAEITLEKLVHNTTENIAFQCTLEELGKENVNRATGTWNRFRVEKYDEIAEKYKFNLNEGSGRLLMLGDVMQYETANRCSPEQLRSKQYKIIIKIAMSEWEAWKRVNNITND